MGDQSALLHCYGKLPLVAEFIEYRLDDESRPVKSWIENGHKLVTGLRGPSGQTLSEGARIGPRRYAYVFDSGRGGKIAVGILHESRDRINRRFPFSFFATIDATGYRAQPALIPVLLQRAWQGMNAELTSFGELGSGDELQQLLDGMTMTVPGPTVDVAKGLATRFTEMKTGDLWKALLPGASAVRRVQLVDLVVRAVQPFTKSKPEDCPVILKMPVSGGFDEACFQTAFWVELLRRMVGGTRFGPNIFMSLSGPGQAPTSAEIFFQSPDDKNFACLMTHRYEVDHVNDLTVELKVALPGSVISGKGRTLLESDDASISDLVEFAWC